MVLSCRGERNNKTCTAKCGNIMHQESLQKRYKAVLRTVKFLTVIANSLCFDLNFALRGFTNHAFVLNCCHVVLCSP